MQNQKLVSVSSFGFANKMSSVIGSPVSLSFNENLPPTFSTIERERLENLLGMALLDHDIQDQLIVQRDPSLFDHFGLSDETQSWLTTIPVGSLKELAQAILDASVPHFQRTAAPTF